MKLKKVMSGILCLVMAITLLAGCGKKANTNETGNQTEKTENKSEGDVDLSEHVTLVMYIYS